MFEQTGVVLSVEDGIATVSFMRASACDGCHKKAEGCTACSLLSGDRRHVAKAKDGVGVVPGDRVRVVTPEGRVLAYAALVFLSPVLFALLGYLVGVGLFYNMAWAGGAFAALGFCLALLMSFFVSLSLGKRPPDAEIIAVIKDEESE